ncbi:MAG: HAMP domain-containing sensor histidine kinase [Clostridia bacterium]|nr:HAMP domain-containing sensor histidine kinase [Clostridia bacterium]
MFKKLRKKIIISNMVLFGVLVLALLGAVYALAYVRMSFQVDDSLESSIMAARSSSFLLPSSVETDRLEPNSIIIFVDATNEEIGYISDESYYSRDILNEVVDGVMEQSKAQGKLKIGENYLAYDLYRFYDVVRIVIYDYTLLQSSLTGLLFILLGVYVLSLATLFFVSRLYADRAVKPIENAFNKQRELVANASHELKTPITVITTSLSIINSNPSETVDYQKKWFNNIHTQTQRMSSLVSDMLDLAKADNFNAQSLTSRINVSDILQGVLLSMEASFFDNGFEINESIDANLSIKADTESLEKLFYILIDNAVKYTPPKGRIDISLAPERRKVRFSVRNYGVSIPQDKLPKIFDRFYRVEESHTQGAAQSFGLGLAIAKSIVDGLGGSMNVSSSQNEYTEFNVFFKI